MLMGWLVWSWGERWGAFGMGCTERWGGLCNPNGVVSSDYLEGLTVADGPKGDEFGTTGFGAWTAPAVVTPVWGGALAQRLKMELFKKSPTPLSGACLTMPTRDGLSVMK